MKIRHIPALVALTVLLPFAASAFSIDDLQAQIQSLLAQIAQIQQQMSNGGGGQITGTTPPVGRTCPQILRTLNQGMTGSDVSDVQAYLGVSQTGYFGPATAQAVAQFQASEGLSQVGIVGPQTRAAFARRCGGGGNNTFSASPTSGPAPLYVQFKADTNLTTCQANSPYTVNFGDGTSAQMEPNGLGTTMGGSGAGTSVISCGGYFTDHRYTSNGTYTAVLTYQPSFNCPPGAMCPQMMPAPQIVGTATITVGGSISNGAPVVTGVDGPAALNVGQTGTWTVHASVSNNTSTNTNLRYSVIWGDEPTFAQIQAYGSAAPTLATSGSFTHAYANAGTYKPTFTVANDAGSAQTSATVAVGGSTNSSGIFSATPTSGSAPLAVHFAATNMTMSPGNIGDWYTVDFGDGTSGNLALSGCIGAIGCADHTYASAGTYTARVVHHPDPAAYCPATDGTYCGSTLNFNTVTITVGGSTSTANFSAYPTSGTAPLSVHFTYPYTTGDSAVYTVNFDDGSSARMFNEIPPCAPLPQGVPVPENYCRGSWAASHIYTSPGIYSATLFKNTCPMGAYCLVGPQQIGTVTITVGGTNSQTFSAHPTAGQAPLTTYFWSILGDGSADGYSITFGDGTSGPLSIGCAVDPLSGTNACPRGLTANHTYTSNGTYTATLVQKSSCPFVGEGPCVQDQTPYQRTVGTVTITVAYLMWM